MRVVPRSARHVVIGALAALLLSFSTLPLSPPAALAQRQPIDPRLVSLKPADLPRGFIVVESETASEPLRVGQADADVVGVTFRTTLERPRSLENIQSGPVKVSQMIARSDDPARATFSLAAQREYNLRENGYEAADGAPPSDDFLCLVRHDGPFVEYRVDAVKNSETLVSTTVLGLPSALNLNAAIALSKVSLSRYDEQLTQVLAVQPPPAAPVSQSADFRAVATPTPAPTQAPVPTQAPAPTALPAAPVPPTPTPPPAVAAAPAPKVKLPSKFDDRMTQPWSELMASTATTSGGEKLPTFLRRVVEKTNIGVKVGGLRPNVGGELQSVASKDGDKAKIIESSITINKDVMDESPRVLAAMLAHEITHANQPLPEDGDKGMDCLEAEVEAYGIQARVWTSFWGGAHPPGGTSWERSMNYIAEVWQDSGDAGLRQLIREETDTDAHSCIDGG
jgi:hypothetical protein